MTARPPPLPHTLILPTSWGANCFEWFLPGTLPNYGLPLDPWDWIGASQLAPGTLSPILNGLA